MQLKELKECILKNTLPSELVILVAKENKFLAKQYLDYIVNNNESRINYINKLNDVVGSALALVFQETEPLNILKIDNFAEVLSDYSAVKNTIIICDAVDKSIESAVQNFIIKLPNFEAWQVKDYMQAICSGLDESDINWLYNMSGGDIYKISNELDKIKLFPNNQQTNILTELHFEDGTDLYKRPTYDIIDAILANNKASVLDALQHRSCIDLTGFYTITSLLNKLKQNLFLNFKSGVSWQDAKVKSSNAAVAIQNHPLSLSEAKQLELLNFLTSLDQKVKTGSLDFTEDSTLVDYVLCRVFSIMR